MKTGNADEDFNEKGLIIIGSLANINNAFDNIEYFFEMKLNVDFNSV